MERRGILEHLKKSFTRTPTVTIIGLTMVKVSLLLDFYRLAFL